MWLLCWFSIEGAGVHPVIEVRRIHDWALPPYKRRVERHSGREEAHQLREGFRYHRAFRRPEACPPWVLGQEAGWVLPAPVALTLEPFQDVQIGAEEDLAAAGRLLGVSEFWRRGEGYIGTERTSWLRSYQYRGKDDSWEAMFIPNGDGTVEWHLGWGARIPAEYLLLITGCDDRVGLSVPTGLLTDRQVNRSWENGFSIAIRPTATVQLRRGDPVARMLLLHRDSLQATLREQP